jgi:hypothetical protein
MLLWCVGLSVGKGDVNNTISSMLSYAKRSTRMQVCIFDVHKREEKDKQNA